MLNVYIIHPGEGVGSGWVMPIACLFYLQSVKCDTYIMLMEGITEFIDM